MSRAYHAQNPNHIFNNRAEIEAYLHQKISSNTGKKIGTEIELFVTDAAGQPAAFDQIEKILLLLSAQFGQSKAITEKNRIVGLSVPGFGDYCLEPGGQIEIATKACEGLEELERVNRRLRAALDNAAASLDLKVTGTGHMPAFLAAGDVPRSRFHAYYAYCRAQYGADAEELIKTMKSVCGLQINLDPMGDDFYKVYRALMTREMTEIMTSPDDRRQKRLRQTYERLAPEQLTPAFNAAAAKSNDALVTLIVDRIMTLKVPFLPDPVSAEGFKSTMDTFGYAPRVQELLDRQLLSVEIFDNALSLQLTMPNLRRHGVLETRAPDSVNTVDELMAVAKRYYQAAYDPATLSARQDDEKTVTLFKKINRYT